MLLRCFQNWLLRATATKAVTASAFFHVGGVAIALGLATTHSVPQFSGNRRVIQVVQTMAVEVPSTIAVEPLEFSELPEPVEITPRGATMEKHQFVETPTNEPATDREIDTLAKASVFEPPVNRAQSEALAQPVVRDGEETLQVQRQRAATPPPLSSAAAAALPQMIGTDERQPPSFVNNPPPIFPEVARRNGWEGNVKLQLHVAEDGRVTAADVAESSGHAVLDAAAVNAVKQWRGTPPTRNGRPVAGIFEITFRFRQ